MHSTSLHTVSSSTPLVERSSSSKKPTMLTKLFKRSTSRTSPSKSAPPPSSEAIFQEVMALNARHGHPSVQALSVKTSPRTVGQSTSSSTERASSSSQSPQDVFAEIMSLNAKHGHPSVQAFSVR